MEQYFQPNVLKVTGAWPLPNDCRKELLKRVNCAIISILISFGVMALMYDIIYNTSDPYLAFKGFLGTLILSQDVLKNLSFLVRRDFLREILQLMNELYKNTPLPNTVELILETTEKHSRIANYWTKLNIGSFGPVMLTLFAYPLFIYLLINELQVFIMTVFNNIDMRLAEYLLLYVVDEALGVCVMLVQITAITLFSTCLLFVCSRVDVLIYSMEVATAEAVQQHRVTPLFGKCVAYHNQILLLIKKIEILYSPLLLTQFFVSSTAICIVSFLLTQVELDLGQQFIFILYFVGINIEMFVFCYFGQLVQTKFEILHMAGFHYSWYEAPLAYRKNICFYLLLCSKPVVLTAGKIKNINLEYYYSLCKLTMSYYTLLRSVVDD